MRILTPQQRADRASRGRPRCSSEMTFTWPVGTEETASATGDCPHPSTGAWRSPLDPAVVVERCGKHSRGLMSRGWVRVTS